MANTPWDPTRHQISYQVGDIANIYIYINYDKYDIITIVIQANYPTKKKLFNELPVGSQYIPLKRVISQRPSDFRKRVIQIEWCLRASNQIRRVDGGYSIPIGIFP